MPENFSAAVAGHICLDRIPELSHRGRARPARRPDRLSSETYAKVR